MTIDKGQVNTRERALSSDWNRQTELGNRAIAEALSAAVSGQARESGVLGDSGFLVTPQNGTMKSAIGPGLALFYDQTKVYPASTMVWCESREIREVTHDAADGLARFDVVEMQPGQLISSTQPRDQFDPLTGTFTVVNVTKEIKSYPAFQARKGTPSASPSIPAGTPGWMPLAYVLIPGGAVSVTQTKVVYCRPILGSRSSSSEAWTTSASTASAKNVAGGGVAVIGAVGNEQYGDGLEGVVVSEMSGRFSTHHHAFRLSKDAPIGVTPMNYDGGGLPATGVGAVVYFYAIPPPYPTGYSSSMAGRELWSPDPTLLYSSGFVDTSLQSGCLIVGSSEPPDVRNPAGPTADVGHIGQFDHAFFSSGVSTSPGKYWSYVGSASVSAGPFFSQECIGALVAPSRCFNTNYEITISPITNLDVVIWEGSLVVDQAYLPVTARELIVSFVFNSLDGGGYNTGLQAGKVATLAVDTNTQSAFVGDFRNTFSNLAFTNEPAGIVLPVFVNDTGTMRITRADSNASADTRMSVRVQGYHDLIMRMR